MGTTRTRRILLLLAIGSLALGAMPASADDVKIVAPPPSRDRLDTPGRLSATPPSEELYYPGHGPIVPHDPAFIPPFVTKPSRDSGVQLGIAGWTSPNIPVGASGAGLRENNGWVGFGLAAKWGTSPRRNETPPAPAPAPRARAESYSASDGVSALVATERKVR